jgi:hypothetical protein
MIVVNKFLKTYQIICHITKLNNYKVDEKKKPPYNILVYLQWFLKYMQRMTSLQSG